MGMFGETIPGKIAALFFGPALGLNAADATIHLRDGKVIRLHTDHVGEDASARDNRGRTWTLGEIKGAEGNIDRATLFLEDHAVGSAMRSCVANFRRGDANIHILVGGELNPEE